MSITAAITAFFQAFTAWCNTAAIRERRELRQESIRLRHEILQAADAGNDRLRAELQDAYTDNQRDRASLLAAASPQDSKRGGDSNG